MALKNPTNNDIVKVLDLHYSEYIARFTAIEDQVRKTNGRVTLLETDKSNTAYANNAIEAYKLTQNVKPTSQAWYDNTKLVGAIVFLITAVATVISLGVAR